MDNTKILLFGPDSVWVNVSYGDRRIEHEGDEQRVQPEPRPLDALKYEELDTWQELAREKEKPVPTLFEFAGAPLLMYPNSGGLTSSWRFILRNDALELKVGMGKRNGIIGKVRFSAEYLWEHRDLGFALRELHTFLVTDFFEAPVYLGASEVHVCADLTGYDFAESEWQYGFIRRSAFTPHFQDYTFIEDDNDEDQGEEKANDVPYLVGPDRLHMRYRTITGFTFGSHKSAVSAVIYNKSNYIKYKAKTTTWFYVSWQAAGWDGESEVWRVEIRLKRPALRESGIHSAYDLVEKLAGIWQYGTQEWLRYVVPGSDSNRARWPVHDAWLVVQMAYQQTLAPGQLEMGPIIREHKRVANIGQIVAQIVGCFISLHAWRLLDRGMFQCSGDLDLSEVLHDFYPNAVDYLDEKERKHKQRGKHWSLVEEVRYKQMLYRQAAAVA